MFRRLAGLILDSRDRILDTIQAESGKARLSAFEEVMDAARAVRVFAGRAPGLLRPRRRGGAIPVLTRTLEHHRPLGVVAIINAWNYPFNLPASDGAEALLAGNAVLLKPDSQTPFTALLLAELLAAAGLPDELLPGAAGLGRGARSCSGRRGRPPDVHRFHGHRTAARRRLRRAPDRLLRRTGARTR